MVAARALRQAMGVVHPGVVAAQVPAPDQQQRIDFDGVRQEIRLDAREVPDEGLGRAGDLLVGRLEALQERGRERAEVDAVWRGLERLEGELLGVRPRANSRGDARHRIRHRLVFDAGRLRVRGAEAVEDLPVVAGALGLLEHRRVVARDVAHREGVEDDVVVLVGQHRSRRQDHVRVARRLVHGDVDRGHELEAGEGAVEAPAVRRRGNGIARDGEHRADLPVARGLDLVGHRGRGQLAAEHGAPGDARLVAPGAAGLGAGPRHRNRGEREHRAAHRVEIPGEEIQQLDEPLANGAEGLRRQADAPVNDRGRRVANLLRDGAHRLGGNSRRRRRALHAEGADRLDRALEPRQSIAVALDARRPELEHRVHQREEECGIGAGADEVVARRDVRRLGAARIDDDDLAAAFANRLQSRGDVGHRHDAAVGRDRIAAEDQPVHRAVHVGDGNHEKMPVHRVARDVLRQLVDGRRRETVARLQRADERRPVEDAADVVRVGIAKVEA